ncbi:hypothetical protein E2562_005254 [Oryza meyeriana var. granulata]|uniref:Retrotransposon gag domain-containing protein n=1 Tax=Oryza meyeriana var. granulata TaxID=110450 RepID=A0A6G1EFW1_9ORYZ|nr:hypothetical protein E2562_005254 [Oryza meyeriana var. granulata]
MVNTRRGQATGTTDEVPPPPNPATLAEVMATQTQLLQAIVNNQGNRRNSNFNEFMRTKPPTFAGAEEPMDAKDWLHLMEKKLTLVHVRQADKVIFTANQLEGTGGTLTRRPVKKEIPNQGIYRSISRELHACSYDAHEEE